MNEEEEKNIKNFKVDLNIFSAIAINIDNVPSKSSSELIEYLDDPRLSITSCLEILMEMTKRNYREKHE
jgi:hypothetical protein